MKNQISVDEVKPSSEKQIKKRKISALQIVLTIYGLLYLVFIIGWWIPFDGYDRYGHLNITVNMAFVLFLVGYFTVWKNEGVAGVIFIFWWIVMWIIALFIAESDRGSTVVMGFPLFILGLLFIISWYRKKVKER